MDISNILELIGAKRKVQYPARDYYYYRPKKEVKDTYYEKVFKNKNDKKIDLVYTNWFKKLVKQKINYSLSRPLTYDTNIPFNMNDIIKKASKQASLDGKTWIHLFINKSSEKLDWVIITDDQIIPVWDEYKKYIISIIRFWVEEKKAPNDKDILYVQEWTPQDVTEYIVVDDLVQSKTVAPHYFENLIYDDKEEQINPMGFGFVPFIPLSNNDEAESDIEGIQELLDVYNQISTGFIDNIYTFQEALMVLKNFGGQNLEEFVEQLQKYKVIPVNENGGIEYMKVDIPVEARKVLLDILKKNIFIIGCGVISTELEGSNITNVVIKAKYSDLDGKCSEMEHEIILFYEQLVAMVNIYNSTSIDSKIQFNRSQIFNVSEMIKDCVNSIPLVSSGLLSKQTLMKNDPRIEDVDNEIKLIDSEKQTVPTGESGNQ